MKHKGQAVWLQQPGQHQTVLYLPRHLQHWSCALTCADLYTKVCPYRTCEDCVGVDLVPHTCKGLWMWCLSLLLRNSVLPLKEKWVWSGAILLFCFVLVQKRHRNTEQASVFLLTKQLGMDDMLFFFETARKETGFLLESRHRNVYGKNLCGPLESPQRGVQHESRALTTGERSQSLWSEMPWKNCTLFTAKMSFVLQVRWFTYRVRGSLTPSQLTTQNVIDTTFYFHCCAQIVCKPWKPYKLIFIMQLGALRENNTV